LSVPEKSTIEQARAVGLPMPHQEEADSTTAALLNVLPGIGNMYLGGVTEEKWQWALGAVNLLLWPISIVWGVPQAAIDAETINEKYSAQYYMFGEGEAQLERASAKAKP
jgi:hypothetical protein